MSFLGFGESRLEKKKEVEVEENKSSPKGGNSNSTGKKCAADRPREPPASDSHATERVVLLTGISGTPCNTPWGDYLLEVQLRNKADWARLHGERDRKSVV